MDSSLLIECRTHLHGSISYQKSVGFLFKAPILMYMGKNLRAATSEQNTFELVQPEVIDFKGKVVGTPLVCLAQGHRLLFQRLQRQM